MDIDHIGRQINYPHLDNSVPGVARHLAGKVATERRIRDFDDQIDVCGAGMRVLPLSRRGDDEVGVRLPGFLQPDGTLLLTAAVASSNSASNRRDSLVRALACAGFMGDIGTTLPSSNSTRMPSNAPASASRW